MSFDWNLSSSSEGEEEDLESWTRRQGFLVRPSQTESTCSSADEQTNDEDGETILSAAAAAAAAFFTGDKDDSKQSKQQELFSMSNVFAGNDNEQDDDEIDWEDADDDDDDDDDNNNNNAHARVSQPSLQPVTIQLGSSENSKNGSSPDNNNNKKKKRQQRRRQSFRFETLAPSVQALLQNLHNAHLLTLTSRAVGLSAIASDPEVLAIAHSLVPLIFFTTTSTTQQQQQQQPPPPPPPTLQQVQAFYSWYIDFVHGVEERRMRQQQANWAAGAPRQPTQRQQQHRQRSLRTMMNSSETAATNTIAVTSPTTLDWKTQVLDFCAYLSPTNEQDPQLLLLLNTDNDNTAAAAAATTTTIQSLHQQTTTLVPLLFLAMVRSLGWRARFIQVMDVMPLDLNIHHPILTGGDSRGCIFWIRRAAAASQTTVPRTTSSSKSTSKNSVSPELKLTNGRCHSSWNELAASTTDSPCIMNWIEVSCMADSTKAPLHLTTTSAAANSRAKATVNPVSPTSKPTKRQWIHVDPVHRQFNQPHQVESLWKRQQQQEQTVLSTLTSTSNEAAPSDNNVRNRRRQTRRRSNVSLSVKSQNSTKTQQEQQAIAYVLAVEHASVLPTEDDTTSAATTTRTASSPLGYMRVTDVTPRYAASWIASLRLRGLMRDKRSLQRKKKKSARTNMKNGAAHQHHDHLNMSDTWWSKTLHTLNQYSKDYHRNQQLQMHGMTPETAICLDMDNDDDGDKKPAAIDPANLNQQLQHVLHHDDDDDEEAQELQASAANEAIPTSKAAFQTHPLYVIPSVLGVAEVLAPDATNRICGVFKGELVYRRTDVSTALPARKWPYQGRKVKKGEKPVKIVKARKKATPKTFRALASYGVGDSNDGSEERRAQDIALAETALEDGTTEPLFAVWQTETWSPAVVGPNDPIPVNEYKNVELELLNPGLAHIDVHGAAKVAKKLSIAYAPCLLGFEGHGGNRTPTIRGIVVHQHNAEMIREAMVEVTHFEAATKHENRRKAIFLKWKKLMVGLLTKERLEREYGDSENK